MECSCFYVFTHFIHNSELDCFATFYSTIINLNESYDFLPTCIMFNGIFFQIKNLFMFSFVSSFHLQKNCFNIKGISK